MNFSTAKSERITAIISAVVAVIILAGGVVAYQSHHAPVEDIVQLESDLRFQLEVAFRHDPNERAARLVALENVSQAWQQSPRSAADQEKLSLWLLEATIRSMPGSIEDLPGVPKFGATVAPPAEPKSADVDRADIASDDVTSDDVIVEPTREPQPQTSVPPTVPTPAAAATKPAPVEYTREVVTQFPQRNSVATQSSVVMIAAPQPVGINLAELSARVAGYHAGLEDIEAELRLLDDGELDAVSAQLDQLAELAADYRFVKLYHDALTEEERRMVTSPRPLTTTLSAVERKLAGSSAAPVDDFLGDFDASHQARVDRLREQLRSLASRVEQ